MTMLSWVYTVSYTHLDVYKRQVKDNKLYRRRQGTADIELKPESATKFFYGDGTDRQIEFVRDADGKVTKGWFINMGQKGEMKRVE